MNLQDFFGHNPHRPDHPDFWRLSGIVLRLDSLVSEAPDEDAKDRAWGENLARWIDSDDALYYMAFQRSARALEADTMDKVRENMGTLTRMMVLYSEGFQIGAEFVIERMASKELSELNEDQLRLLLSNYERHVRKAHEEGAEPLTVADYFKSFEPGDES